MRVRVSLAGMVLAGLLLSSCGPRLVMHFYPDDLPLWERVFREDPFELPPGPISAAILPHHDLMLFPISRMHGALAQRVQPPVVVLIAPNHFEARLDQEVLAAESVSFTHPWGTLEPDALLTQQIVKTAQDLGVVIEMDQDLWPQEHGVFTHIPFLARHFPQSRLVALVVRPESYDSGPFRLLAQALDAVLPPDSLVLASVDFSHYQIREVADFHDAVTRAVIASGEDPAFLEIDSPESVAVVQEFARLRGAPRATLLHQTNSDDGRPDPLAETTSHQYWVFQPGATYPDHTRTLTLLIGGAGNPGVGVADRWTWDRHKKAPRPGLGDLALVAGKEARFFRGWDALVLDPQSSTELTRHGATLAVHRFQPGDTTYPDLSASPVLLAMAVTSDPSQLAWLQQGPYSLIRVDGPSGATLWVRQPSGPWTSYDLGTFSAPGQTITGSLAAISWTIESLGVRLFPYTSTMGYPPAIHQFGVEEQ